MTLKDMTQDKWNALTTAERNKLRSLDGLTKQLIGLEGWRVEIEEESGDKRRFIVGRSTGWIPCHIEVNNRRSFGGPSANASYKSVKPLYKAK
jgi:hypothetical protein